MGKHDREYTIKVYNAMAVIIICWVYMSKGYFCEATCDIRIDDNNQSLTLSNDTIQLSVKTSNLTRQWNVQWSYVDTNNVIISDNICTNDIQHTTSICSIRWPQNDTILSYDSVYVRARITDGECENVTDRTKMVKFSTPWIINRVLPNIYSCEIYDSNVQLMVWTLLSDKGIQNRSKVVISSCQLVTPDALFINVTCDKNESGTKVYIHLNRTTRNALLRYRIRCSNDIRTYEGSQFEEIIFGTGTTSAVLCDIRTEDANITIYPNVKQEYEPDEWRKIMRYIVSGVGSLLVVVVALILCHKLLKGHEHRVAVAHDNVIYATSLRTNRPDHGTDNNQSYTTTASSSNGMPGVLEEVHQEDSNSLVLLDPSNKMTGTRILSHENPYSLASFQTNYGATLSQYYKSRILTKGNVYSTGVAVLDTEV